MSLFRDQALQAQSGQWLGAVHLHSAPPLAIASAIAAVLACSLIAFAAWGQVARKAHLVGVLTPEAGAVTVQSRDAGIVVERRVAEGQSVKSGDVLLVVDADRAAMQGDGVHEMGAQVQRAIEARLQALHSQRELREEQFAVRSRALSDRVRILGAQYDQTDGEQRLLVRRLELARAAVSRHEALAKSGFVSDADLQQKQEERLDVEARLQGVRRTLLGIANDREALASERDLLSSQLKTELADLDRTIEAAKQESIENAGHGRTAVTAPCDGTVTAINLLPGQAVQSGQALLTLIAEAPGQKTPGKLIAHLYAPSQSAGFLREGQHVYLRYDAYPYQKFGMASGRVIAVSGTPFAPSELPSNIAQQLVSRIGAQESLFRAVVELDSQSVHALGNQWPLKAGLTLDADITQEQRAVWEWMLGPLLSLKGAT